MVIGNGMIATRFESYGTNDAFVIFASGVSNSGNKDSSGFEREAGLIKKTISGNPGKQFVYFSTCSIYDPSLVESDYVIHKKQMEELIISLTGHFTIFRVSNPIGNTGNPYTMLNFFIRHIMGQQELTVWQNASRNILDLDDMYSACDKILQDGGTAGQIINIANPSNYSVPEILLALETHFGRKGIYNFVEKGNGPMVDTSFVSRIFRQLNITFTGEYLPSLLNKYYPIA
ncbi:NAD(P)-dependent oxidoreductase [Ferruginibacter sp. HRS2-29]|uniref:NAD-dependent epimerase/dehydratase family protein n=1 Tax=Ferruginibacter sp. HRS2-29 TaxID=2487334 RepID=UPI0020CC2266|nr:NAD-dependent epimerase/dehydratase family protein [Ferruginibacter sp. HRS2-29]MCP9750917.1 NAD-dependent epimerase/dehydratase family protein [Ferruginibacter sp. HRS2-29]